MNTDPKTLLARARQFRKTVGEAADLQACQFLDEVIASLTAQPAPVAEIDETQSAYRHPEIGQYFRACVNGVTDEVDARGRYRRGRQATLWPRPDVLCRITRLTGRVITEYQWRCMVPSPCCITSYVLIKPR